MWAVLLNRWPLGIYGRAAGNVEPFLLTDLDREGAWERGFPQGGALPQAEGSPAILDQHAFGQRLPRPAGSAELDAALPARSDVTDRSVRRPKRTAVVMAPA